MARKKALEEEQLTDTTYYLLLALTEPLHGYGMMQRVREISCGEFEIGPASLYTSLRKLEQAGLIAVQAGETGGKKVYRMTETGRIFLERDFHRRERLVEQGRKILHLEAMKYEQNSKKNDL